MYVQSNHDNDIILKTKQNYCYYFGKYVIQRNSFVNNVRFIDYYIFIGSLDIDNKIQRTLFIINIYTNAVLHACKSVVQMYNNKYIILILVYLIHLFFKLNKNSKNENLL